MADGERRCNVIFSSVPHGLGTHRTPLASVSHFPITLGTVALCTRCNVLWVVVFAMCTVLVVLVNPPSKSV